MPSRQTNAAAMAPKARLQVRARRREIILRAATDVFYETGLREATMDAIARRLRTSKVAVYRYFATKEDLVSAVLQRVAERFIAVEHRPWSGLEPALRESLALAREDAPAYLLLFRASGSDPALARFAAALRAVVEESTRRRLALLGQLDGIAPALGEAIIRGLIDFLFAAVAHWVEHGDPAQDARWLRWAARSGGAIVGWDPKRPVPTLPPVLPGPRP